MNVYDSCSLLALNIIIHSTSILYLGGGENAMNNSGLDALA